jgi:mannose-6-phosphate isomerase-like protein (cupin superfamily)
MKAVVKERENGDVIEKDGVRYIIKAKTDKMLVLLAEIEERAETGIYQHEGEEFRFLLEGELECEVDGVIYRIKAGDAIWHPSDVPHKIKNTGKGKAVYLTVGVPPTFI